MTDQAQSEATAKVSTSAPAVATVLLGVAVFVREVVGGLYRATQEQPSEAMSLLCTLLLWTAVAAWFTGYCRTRRIQVPMDMGWFLMLAWPAVVPYYVLTAEGRRGLARIGLFCFTYFAAWAAGSAIDIWGRVLLGAE